MGAIKSSVDFGSGSNIPGGGGGPGYAGEARNGGDKELDKLADAAYEAFSEAKEDRKLWDRDWDTQLNYWAGRQTQGKLAWKPDVTINLIRPIIEAIVAHMTDADPTITVSAKSELFVDQADTMQQVMYQLWNDNDMSDKINLIVRDALIYGTSYAKTWYDKRAKLCRVEALDVRRIYPSKGATSVDDALYIIYADNVHKAVVESMFPEAKGKLNGGTWDDNLTLFKNVTSNKLAGDIPGVGYIGGAVPGIAPKSGPVQSVGKGKNEKDFVTYIEYWHRDKDPRNWDDIWCTIAANGVVLSHKKNPFNHKKFPFVKLVDIGQTNTFFGMGEVQQLINPQNSLNARRSQIINLLMLGANPPFLVPHNSGIPNITIANTPGIMLRYQAGSKPEWAQPMRVEPALFQLNELDKREMEEISGVADITKGRAPKGVTAAQGIALLSEEGKTMIRPKIRNFEMFLKRLGALMLSDAQQFMTEEQELRVAGKRKDDKQFITINQPGLDENKQPTVKNNIALGKYDVNISVGSFPDYDKVKKFQAIQMLLAGPLGAMVPPKIILDSISELSQDEKAEILANIPQAPPMGPEGPEGPPPEEDPGSAPVPSGPPSDAPTPTQGGAFPPDYAKRIASLEAQL